MSFGAVSALGFARFSYALLLPPMRASLHWSYFTAGLLSVVNAGGYLLGALSTAFLAHRIGTKKVFYTALLCLGPVVGAVGFSTSLPLILMLRVASGVFGAMVFIAGGSLVAYRTSHQSQRQQGAALGLYYGGAGLGTALSGAGIGLLLPSSPSGYHVGWIALGICCLIGFGIAYLVQGQVQDPPPRPKAAHERTSFLVLWPSLLCYGIFGGGYISYMTFVVAYLRHNGASGGFETLFYVVLGLVAALSGFLWDRPLAHLRGGTGLASTLGMVFFGSLVAVVFHGSLPALVSALLFGLGFMAASTAFTRVAQRNMRPAELTGAIGVATVAIAVGQSTGPLLSGILSDTPSGLSLGMEAACLLIGVSVVIALLQRDHLTESVSLGVDPTAQSLGHVLE